MHTGSVRRKPRRDRCNEPDLEGLELESDGEEWMVVMGRTEGGAPYGVRLSELDHEEERDPPRSPRVRAENALRTLLDLEGPAVFDAQRGVKIGTGLSREAFAVRVEHEDRTEQVYVILVPRHRGDAALSERTSRELRLLARLRRRPLPFRIPALVGAIRDGEDVLLVRHHARGLPLDLRAGRQQAVRPWAIVAQIAAAIHGVGGAEVRDVACGHETRRAHVLDRLSVFEGLEAAELRAAHAWALAHLPPDDPATLVHGDLLGANILLSLDGAHHVIDWEYALRGDPAYDLAIVTRATKRPFQMADGLDRLLESYETHGGCSVAREHVQVHELCLVARWYREALAGRGAHAPDVELDRMRSLLRRLR